MLNKINEVYEAFQLNENSLPFIEIVEGKEFWYPPVVFYAYCVHDTLARLEIVKNKNRKGFNFYTSRDLFLSAKSLYQKFLIFYHEWKDQNFPFADWANGDFDYDKVQYEVKTKSGETYICWPNAGKLYALNSNLKDCQLDNAQVLGVRESYYQIG